MHREFWMKKWDTPSPGFNQKEVNANLSNLACDLWGSLEGMRIFVPLCGKSVDMLWLLQQKAYVVGVELSELACQMFFEENQLSFSKNKSKNFTIFEGENIKIFCGDLFNLRGADIGDCNGVYDRAALIALPADIRKKYSSFICGLNIESLFIISLEYQGSGDGQPPFPVFYDEVSSLFSGKYDLKIAADTLGAKITPRLSEIGVFDIREKVYFLKRKK